MKNKKRLIDAYGISVSLKFVAKQLSDGSDWIVGYKEGLLAAVSAIAECDPIDAVEVVRCKDCWKSGEGLCSYHLKNAPGKDFCGDGERWDDNV